MLRLFSYLENTAGQKIDTKIVKRLLIESMQDPSSALELKPHSIDAVAVSIDKIIKEVFDSDWLLEKAIECNKVGISKVEEETVGENYSFDRLLNMELDFHDRIGEYSMRLFKIRSESKNVFDVEKLHWASQWYEHKWKVAYANHRLKHLKASYAYASAGDAAMEMFNLTGAPIWGKASLKAYTNSAKLANSSNARHSAHQYLRAGSIAKILAIETKEGTSHESYTIGENDDEPTTINWRDDNSTIAIKAFGKFLEYYRSNPNPKMHGLIKRVEKDISELAPNLDDSMVQRLLPFRVYETIFKGPPLGNLGEKFPKPYN